MQLLSRAILSVLVLTSLAPARQDDRGAPPVRAPYDGLDTLVTNDWWNRDPSKIVETRVPRDEVIAFGIYTVHDGVLKLTAQLFPLYPDETRTVRLEVKRSEEWVELAWQKVNDLGWAATFRVENWNDSVDVPYSLRHGDVQVTAVGEVPRKTVRRIAESLAPRR